MTRHTAETRAQAILRPGTTRDVGAALSIPKESVRNWRAAYRSDPDALGPEVRRLVEAASAVNEAAMVSRLWDSFVAGIDAAQLGIDRATGMLARDDLTPEQLSRLLDSTTAGSERLARQWQLLTDRPTDRTVNANLNLNGEVEPLLTPDEDEALRDWLRSMAEQRLLAEEAGDDDV